MKSYLVGCDKTADIVITDAASAVSNVHLELTEETGGKY